MAEASDDGRLARAVPRLCARLLDAFGPDSLTGTLAELERYVRLFARKLPRYENATPDTIWRHFLDATGTLHITETGVTCALNLRNHHPVLIDAGFADLEIPIPWWHGRPLRFRFPPR
jgi:hypothetical protein